jgi:hypothetical protein
VRRLIASVAAVIALSLQKFEQRPPVNQQRSYSSTSIRGKTDFAEHDTSWRSAGSAKLFFSIEAA